jgi:hypothetical protein
MSEKMVHSETDADEAAMSRAGLAAFLKIAQLWGLTTAEQRTLLGSPASSTWQSWQEAAPDVLPRDTLERISHILGIYKNLQLLLPDEAAADAWIRQPNEAAAFGGRAALARMLSGDVRDVRDVRRYLEAQRG